MMFFIKILTNQYLQIKDQRTEIVLATTALVAVVALFLRWHLPSFPLLITRVEHPNNKNEVGL